MTTRESDKATRYVNALNEARLNGDWSAISELVRKVTKHAPSRRCLTASATAEAEIVLKASQMPEAGSTAPRDQLTKEKAALTQALEAEQASPKAIPLDVATARVTLAYCQYLEAQWLDALETLAPKHRMTPADGPRTPVHRLNFVKGCYIYGAASENIGNLDEANSAYREAVTAIEQDRKNTMQYKELHRWANRVLGQLCARMAAVRGDRSVESMCTALSLFRTWSNVIKGGPMDQSTRWSQRQTWEQYHRMLSEILRSNLVYVASDSAPLMVRNFSLPRSSLSVQRNRQYEELVHVQRSYEHLLYTETDFPKANQSNREFERFAGLAMANWRIISGNEWTEADVGTPGKVGYSRRVLELLYTAASRTFHSTPILRHLFTVHASLAEFDLALKAFDAYSEIIEKGKARAEKSGKPENGLDSDDDVLHTAAHAVQVLCAFGERDEAEKAYDIGLKITEWLQQRRPRSSSSTQTSLDAASASERVAAETFSSATALAAAYKGIGQSQGCWARYTFDAKQREELQDDAVSNLRRSLALSQQSGIDLDAAYLLARAQAEKREIDRALATVKSALAKSSPTSTPISQHSAEIIFEGLRSRIPITHLLVLLLSARGDYEIALEICDSTIEGLIDAGRTCDRVDKVPDVGDDDFEGGPGSLPARLKQGMQDAEKECLLQMKITEMELLILLEDVSYAGSKRVELLKMYEQLFGGPKSQITTQQRDQSLAPTLPKSRAGTIKSFRQSILGRPKSMRKSVEESTFEAPPPIPDHPLINKADEPAHGEKAAASTNGVLVQLKVTNEDGESVHHEPHSKASRLSMSIRKGHHRHSHDVSQLEDREKEEETTRRAASETPPVPSVPQTLDEKVELEERSDTLHVDQPATEKQHVNGEHDEQGPNWPLSNGPADVSDVKQFDEPTLRIMQLNELSTKAPPPALSSLQRQKHHVSILVHIWTFISEIYNKEGLYDESTNAVDEAEKLVEMLKGDTAAVSSSARAWNIRGWGLGKPISRLMADVCSERGRIQFFTSSPHAALESYERALAYVIDHPTAVTRLSSTLLDIFEEKVPADPPTKAEVMAKAPTSSDIDLGSLPPPQTRTSRDSDPVDGKQAGPERKSNDGTSPAELNRIACRERAYLLLMIQSKLGESWDDAEVWFELSRAYELMGLKEKAEEVLWWVVGLEDTRPVRPWSCIGTVF